MAPRANRADQSIMSSHITFKGAKLSRHHWIQDFSTFKMQEVQVIWEKKS